MPRVTVVVPCFDHGAYLDEAVGSALAQTFKDLEVVVVDDGSTDPATVALLDGYSRPRTRVIRMASNGGQQVLDVDMNEVIKRGRREKAIRLQANDVVVVPESFF